MEDVLKKFSLAGKSALVTGGTGVLGSRMAEALGLAGARVAVAALDGYEETAAKLAGQGIKALGFRMDAMVRADIEAVRERILKEFGGLDILVNAAGGNIKEATTSPETPFFDLPLGALEKAVGLNLFAGAILPSQVFGRAMAGNTAGGSIINITSMNAFRPLTRIAGYSAAKAAVSNFTQWLAVHLAQEYNKKLRVNAIAPGFFSTKQNKFLLWTEKGELTARGQSIISHTPLGRFGEPSDLDGALLWLASDASAFVTGSIIPVDGGFNAFSGV